MYAWWIIVNQETGNETKTKRNFVLNDNIDLQAKYSTVYDHNANGLL